MADLADDPENNNEKEKNKGSDRSWADIWIASASIVVVLASGIVIGSNLAPPPSSPPPSPPSATVSISESGNEIVVNQYGKTVVIETGRVAELKKALELCEDEAATCSETSDQLNEALDKLKSELEKLCKIIDGSKPETSSSYMEGLIKQLKNRCDGLKGS